MQTPLLCIQIFLLFKELSDVKVLLIDHAVTQNNVFVVFQSEATENFSHENLIKHVKETIVVKVFRQLRRTRQLDDIYAWLYDWDCNTHTITFGYQRHFFSQFNFKLHSMKWFWLFTFVY